MALLGLERPVERGERGIADIHGNGQDRRAGLFGVGERGFRLGQAVLIEEGGKVAIAEPFIDLSAQLMLWHAELGREIANPEPMLAIQELLLHRCDEAGMCGAVFWGNARFARLGGDDRLKQELFGLQAQKPKH